MNIAVPVAAPAYGRVLPEARGPLSHFLLSHLVQAPHKLESWPHGEDDPLDGDDWQLALYLCYELHYRGLAGVDEQWEWEPSLLAFRRELEDGFTRRLIDLVGPSQAPGGGDIAAQLRRICESSEGRSLSSYMAEQGSLEQMREFAIHRSAYQLKEADPHTWCIPRLTGGAKAAMVHIQADEYGQGVERDMHATLFALTMREIGLDATYGAYLEVLPGTTLATVNLPTMFGLQRRWRGALVGHLAVFEMTSVEPMGRYSMALRRLGYGPWARHFYEVHVVADANHQSVAAHDLAGGLAVQEPQLVGDILFGARTVMALEGRLSEHLMTSWEAGTSSLLRPIPGLDRH